MFMASHTLRLFIKSGDTHMFLPFVNFLIKYTRCSVITGGNKITLSWKVRKNFLKFVIPKYDAMLVSLPGQKSLFLRKFTHKKMML